MTNEFTRTQLILGADAMRKLAASRVAVFGVGGVGGYTVEALARTGIGALDLIDNDRVSLSNINRQILATHSSLGRYKVDVAEERVRDISPQCAVRTYKTFYLPETQDQFDFSSYDYVVDAIDTLTGKLTIIENAKRAGVPVISAMGAGNKTDPTAFAVADLYETSVCPLARIMRRECRRRGIESLKVVYSKEKPIWPQEKAESVAGPEESGARRRDVPGSVAFVPSVAGLIIAGEVIRDLTAQNGTETE